jgi:mRNA-degrading endonuclease YafQ of YafQ-DinJ toxin-antitoxin module
MKLVWSSKFTRAVKKLARRKPGLLDDLETVLQQLEADPYHSSLRTHKLSGDFARAVAKSNFRFGDSKVFFPLTPTLSPGEREHSGRSSKRARRLGSSQAGHQFSLSLRERAGVRGNGSPWHPTPIDSEMTFGNQSNCWACSAGYDFRIIFEVVRAAKGDEIHLLNAGTHDEVY